MNNMKLIMESWRNYSDVQDSTLTLLKERADKGLITEEHLAELWLESLEADWNQMINEGIIDALKKGAVAVKKGGKFIADKIMTAYNAAASKVNEWITRLYIGGLDIISRTITKVTSLKPVRQFISGMSSLVEKVKDFKYDHPILFKIVTVTAAIAAVAGIMYLMAGEANAKMQSPDNPNVTMSGAEDTWLGVKGMCTSALEESRDPETKRMMHDCIQIINDYSPGGVHENDVLSFSKDGMGEVEKVIKGASRWFENSAQVESATTDAIKSAVGEQWIAAGKPLEGPIYDQAVEAINKAKEAQNLVQDLVQIGKESTFKIEKITKFVYEGPMGSGSTTNISMGGGISKMQGLQDPEMVKGTGRALSKAAGG